MTPRSARFFGLHRFGVALLASLMLASLLPGAALAATAPTITSAATTTFTVGVAGSFTVTTAGTPTPAIVRTGAVLPSGVTFTDNLNGTGTLAGTPGPATNASYALTFTASNGNTPDAVQPFTLVVSPGTVPTITSAATTTFTVGVAGSFTVTTTGVPAPTIVRTGAVLPSGVTFTNNGNGTGTLAGTPGAATNGSYALTFTASNGNTPNAVQNFTLVVSPPGPSVTINQAVGQADPTSTSPINFTVVFSASVTGFATGDVTISGTAGGTKIGTVTGSGTTYNVAVSGMTTAGTVIADVPAGVANATSGGLPNLVSTSIDKTVTWAPGSTVTINQAVGQADPTSTSPINFTVVFSASVTGFATGDVTISGTAGGTKTGTVTGSGTTYNVAVTGMTTAGTVIADVPAGVAINASSQANLASTSTDNTVTWTSVPASITLTTNAPIPAGAQNPVILWGQGFTLSVQFGTNGASKSFQLQGTRDGVVWTTITTLTTDANGRASLNYRPVTNLFYRAVFAGTGDLGAATSNQVRTVVRQLTLLRPTLSGATRTISRNTSITFTTTVRPARPELAPARVTFVFYHRVGSTWQLVTSRNVFIDSAGLARTTFKFSSAGSWYVRSVANPTPYNANSMWTPVERYSVR